MHVKDKSCSSLQDFRPLFKRDSDTGFFPVNIPNVFGTVFFRTILVAVFNYVLVSERILKKES